MISSLAIKVFPRGVPGVRSVMQHGVHTMFGDPFDATVDPGDPGLMGPGSATWQLLGEPCVMPMGFRALLVQMLHPIALEAVHTHGSFAEDFLGRIKRTALYLQLANFGSTGQALDTSATVQRIHRRVVGRTAQDEPYSAGDPHYLAWVGMTFTESTLAVHHAFGQRPVTDELADRFVAEQAVLNALLDPRVDLDALRTDPDAGARLRDGDVPLPLVEEGQVPTDVAGLTRRLAEFQPELELRELGRASFRWLLDPPDLPLAQRAGWRVFVTSTLATLPPQWRDLLDQPDSPLRDAVVAGGTRTLFDVFRVLHGPLTLPSLATSRVERRPGDGNGNAGDEGAQLLRAT